MIMQNEEIIFLIKVMNGGGAERVISLLANHFVVKGYNVSLLITHQKLKQADLRRLDNSVHVMTLEDELTTSCYDSPWQLIWARFIAKLACLLTSSQDKALIEKYKARNYAKPSA